MIEIVEITRTMKQGQTSPCLCIGDDNCHYIVKGKNTTNRGLIYELVCAELGTKIGLPIPEYEVVYVDNMLVEFENYNLSEGYWFASKFKPAIREVFFSTLPKLDTELLKLLFIFDYWINNADRTLTDLGGNPNLFIDTDSNLVVIDHNLAFDPNYSNEIESIKRSHVSSTFWFSKQIDMFHKETKYKKLLCSALSDLNEISSKIPPEWIDLCQSDNILQEIEDVLQRCNSSEFWEAIK